MYTVPASTAFYFHLVSGGITCGQPFIEPRTSRWFFFSGIATDTCEIVVVSEFLDFVIIVTQIDCHNGVSLIRFYYRCLIYLHFFFRLLRTFFSWRSRTCFEDFSSVVRRRCWIFLFTWYRMGSWSNGGNKLMAVSASNASEVIQRFCL
jgi:hypothetical protein